MRILIVGAGAVGGYFGGRLLQDGRDVTFLVRPRRAAELARDGLVIKSSAGDVTLPQPPTVLADALAQPFDLIILSCKAYDLPDAIAAFAPAVGPHTAILPLLNGMAHLDRLDAAFGAEKVLGGQCVISATLDPQRAIVHLNNLHTLTFGDRAGDSDRVRAILAELQGAGFDAYASDTIVLDMWEKWIVLGSMAGTTTLMRATIGDISATPDGRDFVLGLIDECRTIAALAGYAPRPAFLERIRKQLTTPESTLTASMYRDLEQHAPIEADQIIGDLLRRGQVLAAEERFPLLRLIYANLQAYERHRLRELTAA